MASFDFTIDTDLTTKNAVYDKLYNAIVIGHLKPGERLLERELAEKLGVSRTPIREALLMLEKERLVKAKPYKGITVVKLTLHEAWEIYNMRQVLEGMAVKLAAQRIHKKGFEEDIHFLRENIEKQKIALNNQDQAKATLLNLEFHMYIINMTRHDLLKRMIQPLYVYMGMLANQTMFQRGEKTLIEHGHIVDYIEQGDGDSAQLKVMDHIMALWEFIQANYR